MSEVEIKEESLKERLGKLVPRILKAAIITSIVGVIYLMLWFFISQFFAEHPEYQMLFLIFAWATVLFTFAIRVTDGTIFKFVFIIGRVFFLTIFLIYAANGGVLTLDFMNLHFVVEFIPLLALMILINILDFARAILQALEFTSASPPD